MSVRKKKENNIERKLKIFEVQNTDPVANFNCANVPVSRKQTPGVCEKILKVLLPRKSVSSSIVFGLVMAGIFCSVFSVFATYPTTPYGPGDTLDPGCTPGSSNCSVVAPALYSFGTNNFSGTGTITAGGFSVGTEYSLPAIDGNSGEVLSTNGSGTLTWVANGSGSMVYPGPGIAVSTGSAWGISITNNSANWNSAYSAMHTQGTDSSVNSSLSGVLFATTGTLSTKAIGTDIQAYDAELAGLAGLTYSSGTPFIKMTAAGTFSLDTNTYLTSLSGALLATGATTGATSQSQIFTNGVTLSNLTSGRVTYAGASGVLTDSAAFTFASGNLTLGAASSATGKLSIKGTTSGTVDITTADAAGTWTMTLPANDGDSGQVLSTNGSGVTSWVAQSAAMNYPGAGIAVSTGTAWGTSLTDNHSNWDAGYSHKTTEDAINGLVFVNGAGTYSAKSIGTDIQAYDAELAGLASLSYSSGTPFIKMTAAGTFSLDTNTYLTANQSITLSGAVTGSGTTSISTTLADNTVSAGKMQGASSTKLANGSAGNLLKSLGDGTFGWDTNTYLTSLSGALLATGSVTGATSQAQAFTNGVITGKIYPSADSTTAVQINKADGSTNVVTIDTTSSYVGIGTASPSAKLEVNGAIKANYIYSSSGTSDYPDLSWSADPNTGFYRAASDAIGISLGGSEKFRLAASGLGILNTSPGALLDIGTAGTTLGTMRLEGNTSGYVQIQPAAAAGSYTLTLPTSDGDANQVLTTDGSGALSWTTPGSSMVYPGPGIAVSTGSAWGSSLAIGTDIQAYDAELAGLAGLTYASGTPFIKMTAAGTFALDTNTYLTANQSITLSGAVTGSGTTSISTTLADNTVSAGKMQGASSTKLANGSAGNLLKSLGDGTFGWDTNTYLTSLSGALLATGATTGATSQSQVFTNGVTLSNLTSGRVTYATTSGALTDSGAFTFASGNLTLGAASSATGKLSIKGTTSGTVDITTADAAGTWTMTLPANDGDSGQVLSTNGSGVTSWVAQSAAMNYPGAGIAVSTGTAWGSSLAIGTDIQAYDAELAALAGLSNSAGVLTNNGSGTLSWTAATSQYWQRNTTTLSPATAGDAVQADGGFLSTGTTTGFTIPSGAGTRMMWIPSKYAFRAGEALGDEWDTANIGSYSFAFGDQSSATGIGSIALGVNLVSSGSTSVALGYGNTASGSQSTALGNYSTASGAGSFAGGKGVLGHSVTSAGTGSFAFGYSANSATVGITAGAATPTYGSIAMGYASSGNTLSATGTGSVAIGQDVNSTTNDNILTFGKGLTVSTASTFNVGFGTSITTPDFQVAADAVKVDGTLSVTSSGTTVYSMPTAIGTSGQVLTAPASGTALEWTTPTTGTVTGTGVANQVSYWSSTSAITGNSGFTFDGTTLSAPTVSTDSAGTGVSISGASGVLTLAGTGNTNNENLTVDFETTSNKVAVGTGTGVTMIDFGSINLSAGSLTLPSGSYTTKIQTGTQSMNVTLTLPTTDGDANQVLTTDGYGVLSWSDQSGGFTNPMTTVGDMIYGGTSGAPTRLAGGTTGQILQTNTGAAPSWSTATYPSTATSTGKILRADGTNWAATSATYPNTTTANQILYSTATDTVGGSSGLTYDGTTLSVGTSTEVFTVLDTGKVGINATSPSFDLSFGGDSARTISLERNTTTSGSNLTLSAGGALSGGTNLMGGNLYLKSGTSTGTGSSDIFFQTATPGSSGTSDHTPTTKLTVRYNGNVVVGTAALATDATGGFLYIPSSAGAPTGTPVTETGTVPIQYDTTNHALYIYRGGAWHYITETGGFQIPDYETVDPVSGEQMAEGDLVMGVIDGRLPNDNLHAVWVKWSTVKERLLAEARGELQDSGSINTGEISGVESTTFLDKVKNILYSLGIEIKDGVTSIASLATQKFSADTANIKLANVETMQMVDQKTGDTYCTWIANGEWKKAKGECSTIDFNNPPAETVATTQPQTQTEQTTTTTETTAAAETVATETATEQTAEQSEELSQQQQHAIEQAADQAARTATKQAAEKVVEEVKDKIKEEVQSQLEQQAQTTTPEQQPAQTQETPSAEVPVTETPAQTQIEAPIEAPQESTPSAASEATSAVSEAINEAAAGLFQRIWEVFSWIFKISATETNKMLPESLKRAPAGIFDGAKNGFEYFKQEAIEGLQYKTPEIIEKSTAGFIEPIKNMWERFLANDW